MTIKIIPLNSYVKIKLSVWHTEYKYKIKFFNVIYSHLCK